MWDIAFVDKLARVLYPFLAALAAWYVRRHTKRSERIQKEIMRNTVSTELKVNGRLDELIRAKEQLAYERGRKDAIGDMLTGKLDK
jgi:hypothetical protein